MSKDGVERCTVVVKVRLTKHDWQALKNWLRGRGEPWNDKAVAELVSSSCDFIPPSDMDDELEEGFRP